MAVVPMKKIALLALADDKTRILTHLMDSGVIEINDSDIDVKYNHIFVKEINENEISDLDEKINKTNRALLMISKYDERKKPLFAVRADLSIHDYRKVVFKRHEVLARCSEIIAISDDIVSYKNEINRKKNSILNLQPWELLPYKVDMVTTKTTLLLNGTFPAMANIEAIKAEIEQQQFLCELNIINEDSEQYYANVIVYKENEKEILQYLKRNGLSITNFNNYSNMVSDNISKLKDDVKSIENTIKEKEITLIKYADILNEIEIVYDYYIVRKDMENAKGNMAKSSRIFILEGWIPKEKAEDLINDLNSNWIVDISTRDAYDDEEFPVLLKNGFIGDAAEGITSMYATPNCREADPNTIMAPFYMLFFGLMLSDAGYGLVLALVSGFIYFKVKLEESTKRFIKLMMLSGVATIFWGALFGSWFGNFIPILLGDATKDISIWFDPISDPEYLLMWSLFFGIIHVFVGLGMRAYNLIKKKKYLDVIFDVIVWYVFFVGAVLQVMPVVPGVPMELANSLAPLGKILFPIGAIALLLTQGRKKKGILGKLFGGIASLYDLINFMSDVLSYSRLLALGLATSVIATIVNNMGAMGGFNVVGIIVFILVFAFGHTFNFALNALGAYVHSSRLQYIEFFSKFYEGGGKPFTPFKRNTKYVKIKN